MSLTASATASVAVPLLATLGIAVGLDIVVGEPPRRLHPVAWFGSIVDPFDRRWSRPRSVGVGIAVGLPLVAALAAGSVVGGAVVGSIAVSGSDGAAPIAGAIGAVVAGAVLSVTVSLRMLLAVTTEVVALTESDPDAARESVRALVGRETADLSPAALRSAAVESAAENLADGFVAPLVGFVAGAVVGVGAVIGVGVGAPAGDVGGVEVPVSALPLSLGVAAAVWVKAVNTLDSVLGYRSKPIGWASARLDDAVMYVPARVTAGCLAAAAEFVRSSAPADGSFGAAETLSRAKAWARVPSSPNAGWPMATAAVALDVRLEKPDRYVLNPAADLPTVADADRAVRLVRLGGVVATGIAAAALLVTAAAGGWLAARIGGSVVAFAGGLPVVFAG